MFSSSPPSESASRARPSQRASPQPSRSASSSDLTDSDVEEALANLRKSSRGSSGKSTRSARKILHARSRRERFSPSAVPSASHSSAAEPDVELLDEEEVEAEPDAENWKDIPMSVINLGRRQAIAKKTGKKCPPHPFHAEQLAGRVSGIYTAGSMVQATSSDTIFPKSSDTIATHTSTSPNCQANCFARCIRSSLMCSGSFSLFTPTTSGKHMVNGCPTRQYERPTFSWPPCQRLSEC